MPLAAPSARRAKTLTVRDRQGSLTLPFFCHRPQRPSGSGCGRWRGPSADRSTALSQRKPRRGYSGASQRVLEAAWLGGYPCCWRPVCSIDRRAKHTPIRISGNRVALRLIGAAPLIVLLGGAGHAFWRHPVTKLVKSGPILARGSENGHSTKDFLPGSSNKGRACSNNCKRCNRAPCRLVRNEHRT